MSKSKAEKWAESQPRFEINGGPAVYVNFAGSIAIDGCGAGSMAVIGPEDALALGRWLVDVCSPHPDAAPEPEPVGPFYMWCTRFCEYIRFAPNGDFGGDLASAQDKCECDYITLAPPDPKWTKENPPPRYVPKG